MYVFYKYSDKGKPPRLNNQIISKQKVFQNFYRHFANENIILILDNVNDETVKWFDTFYPSLKKHRTTLGNAGAMSYIYRLITQIPNMNDIAFICEDDYWFLDKSAQCIKEGLEVVDFVNCYDHPDKYMNPSPNPFIKNGMEETRVFLTQSTHWKFTNSTTGSFAMKVITMIRNFEVMMVFNDGHKMMDDFGMFCRLRQMGITLATPIPSKSCHLDNLNPAPLIDWQKEINQFI
jgi:hypothetical protein